MKCASKCASIAMVWAVSSIASAAWAQSSWLAPVWKAEGNQADARFAASVAPAGDVNGDGFGDVLVGADAFDGGEINEGRAFLYLGSPTGLEPSPAWTAESDQAYAYFASTVAPAGDVNGDGFDDVLVGAYFYSGDQYLGGRGFLYLGSAAGLAPNSAWTVDGNQLAAYCAASIATAGDVNGDGYDDVLVSLPGYDGDLTDEGRVDLYFGSAAGLAPSPGWSVEGNQGFCSFGNVTTAGDVNGDGYDDVLIGAPDYNDQGTPNVGRAFLFLGSASGPSTAAAWTVAGDRANAWVGNRIAAAGDVNGDGFGDVLVGAPGYDGLLAGAGRAYLYLGSPAGLAPSPAWVLEGVQRNEQLGWVAGAGDVDGDGFDDVLVGSVSFDHGQRDEGRVQLFFGTRSGLSTRAGWTMESDQPNAQFGYALDGAGDLNGDGLDDVILGAHLFDNGQHDEGRAWALLGQSRHRMR